jgi:hypothetical protein
MTERLNLPEPIAAYFDADKRDSEAIARCFTKDAVVKDEGQIHLYQRTVSLGPAGRNDGSHEPVDRQLSRQPSRAAVLLPP